MCAPTFVDRAVKHAFECEREISLSSTEAREGAGTGPIAHRVRLSDKSGAPHTQTVAACVKVKSKEVNKRCVCNSRGASTHYILLTFGRQRSL